MKKKYSLQMDGTTLAFFLFELIYFELIIFTMAYNAVIGIPDV